MHRALKAPIVFALVALGTLIGTSANADLVTYRFAGSILEAPVELTDLAYGSGPNPLVFTLVVNTGIPADIIADNPPISSSATYSSAIVSATVELGGQVVATSASGSASRYRQFPGLVGAQDVFTYTIPTAGGFSSGPFRGLTPTSLGLDIRAFSTSAFASLALPNPFPALGFPFQEQSLLLTFASPATQPLRSFLTNVTTTTVIPLPAGAWLFASGAGLLPFLRRRLKHSPA